MQIKLFFHRTKIVPLKQSLLEYFDIKSMFIDIPIIYKSTKRKLAL